MRKVASYFVARIVERMGPGRCLSGVKDITDKVLPAAAQFIKDGSPETRYNGRHIIHMLMTHQDFEKMITKHLQANALRNVQETVKTLQTKVVEGFHPCILGFGSVSVDMDSIVHTY